MKFPSRDGWAKFGFEGGLIVVSILLAFTIESWRADRELRSEEQQVLLQLKAEFEANAELLERRRSSQKQILEAAIRVLSVTGPSIAGRSLDIDTFYKDVYLAADWYSFDASDGVLQSLIHSNKLAVIESDTLRTQLAAWPAMVRDVAEDEDNSQNFSGGPLIEYLALHAPLRDIQTRGLQDDPIGEGPGPSRFESDIEKLLADPFFENLIHHKLWLTKWVIAEYEYRAYVIDEIIAAIDSEIDD